MNRAMQMMCSWIVIYSLLICCHCKLTLKILLGSLYCIVVVYALLLMHLTFRVQFTHLWLWIVIESCLNIGFWMSGAMRVTSSWMKSPHFAKFQQSGRYRIVHCGSVNESYWGDSVRHACEEGVVLGLVRYADLDDFVLLQVTWQHFLGDVELQSPRTLISPTFVLLALALTPTVHIPTAKSLRHTCCTCCACTWKSFLEYTSWRSWVVMPGEV